MIININKWDDICNNYKDELLLLHGWEKIEGFAMDHATPEESQKCIITLDEFRKFIGKEAEVYYFFKDDYEFARDLEEAWECLIDDIYNKLDTNDDNVILKYFEINLRCNHNV